VRAYSYDSSLLLKELDGRDGRTNTGIISDGLSVKGYVDITTYENSLSLEGISNILDGLLCLKLGRAYSKSI
jgi:hypothetical protein